MGTFKRIYANKYGALQSQRKELACSANLTSLIKVALRADNENEWCRVHRRMRGSCLRCPPPAIIRRRLFTINPTCNWLFSLWSGAPVKTSGSHD